MSFRPRTLLIAVLSSALAFGCSRPATSGWRATELPTNASFDGVWFTDSLNGWISGGAHDVRGGLLGRTRDGGRTWTIRSDVVPGTGREGFYLHEIQFQDSLHGCVVGDYGLILLTDDGGITWRPARSNTGTLVRLQLQGSDGWALGPAALLGTNDGGETWHELVRNQDSNHYLCGRAAAFTDASHGWLLSYTEPLMRTDDGGLDWTTVPLPVETRGALSDITFVDATHGWLVGEFGVICRTGDGGLTWERQVNGVPVERERQRGEKPLPRFGSEREEPYKLELTSVRFADRQRGFALGHYGDVGESVILGTRDGGETWATEARAPGQFLQRLFVLDRRHAWAVGYRARQLGQALYRYAAAE